MDLNPDHKKFEYSVCGRKFSRKDNAKVHINKQHNGLGDVKCQTHDSTHGLNDSMPDAFTDSEDFGQNSEYVIILLHLQSLLYLDVSIDFDSIT